MWGRRLRAASTRSVGVLPEPRGSVRGTRAAGFRDVPNGTRLRIWGVAHEAGPVLTSPVLDRPCVAYRLVVEEPGWRPVLERTGCTRFLVQDGDVAVSVEGPFRVLLQVDYEWDFGNEVQRRIARLLDAGRSADDEIYCQNYRYFEALIRPGDRVTVEGFASVTVDPAGDRSGPRAPPLLHTLTGTPERPVVITVPEPGSVGP